MPYTRKRILHKEGKFRCEFSHQYVQRAFWWLAHETFICLNATGRFRTRMVTFLILPELNYSGYTIQFDRAKDRNNFYNYLKSTEIKL